MPRKQESYNLLASKKVSGKESEYVIKFRNKFEIKTMKDYYNLYLKCDILFLADVFENFRNNRLKNYGSFSSHYLSAAALIWVAMHNIIKVKLEFIPDADMYLFFKKCMRGGVSCVSKRYNKSNSNCLKSYDPKQESKHIIYFDANNLHVTCCRKKDNSVLRFQPHFEVPSLV